MKDETRVQFMIKERHIDIGIVVGGMNIIMMEDFLEFEGKREGKMRELGSVEADQFVHTHARCF